MRHLAMIAFPDVLLLFPCVLLKTNQACLLFFCQWGQCVKGEGLGHGKGEGELDHAEVIFAIAQSNSSYQTYTPNMCSSTAP